LLRAPLLSDDLITFTLDDGSGAGPNVVRASRDPETSQPSVISSTLVPAIADRGPKDRAILTRDVALLPPGPGRDLTIRACSACHRLNVVTGQRLSPLEWNNVVQTMSSKGALATPAELNIIQSYLAHAFPRPGGEE